MKILVLANDSGGLFHFRVDLLKSLIKDNNEVFVSVPKTNEYESLQKLGCKLIETSVDRRGMNPIRDFRLLIRYLSIIKKTKPDYVITYTIKPNIYGGIACRLKKVMYVENITGLGTAFQKDNILKKMIVLMYKIGLKESKIVFFENSVNRDAFTDNKIIPVSKTHVLHGAGVNLEYFSYADYPNDQDVTRFLFIGRVMREKGVDELLQATKHLVDKGYKLQLEIVGRAEENVSKKFNEAQRQGWLIYHGFQDDVRPFIRMTHCFVLPSWHEGMANTNLESASMGRPVITSDIPGCREAVINGVSGYLAKSKNVESLIQMMEEFLKLSCNQRRTMGMAGRKHMEDVFDKKKVVQETIEVLMK